MSGILENIWPPTKTWKRSILWALGAGFVLQIAVPAFFEGIGDQRDELYSIILGFWSAMWVTGRGWNSTMQPLGISLMLGINTLVYGILLLIGIRVYYWVKGYKA
jgi:hypothetical protein